MWSPLLHCVYGSSTWFIQVVVTEYSGPDTLETGSVYFLYSGGLKSDVKVPSHADSDVMILFRIVY